ncbi:hypothetical protein [Deinococcus marmoris]|uniref:hypothetical protein n=1 Tax=Deinococcus marmoris TaxID=249408 RepID=UPI0012DE4F37|nr:hypothetical protein [Deinococcus marmoris]
MRANGRNDSHYDDLHELNEGVQILLNRPERYVHRRGEGAYAFAQARKDDWIGTDHSLGSRALTIISRLATYAVQLNLAQKEMKGGRITDPEYQAIHTFIEGCMESTIHAMEKNSSFATGPLSDYYEELRGSHSCYEPFDYYRNVICPEAKTAVPFGTDAYGQARFGPLFSSDR